MIPDALGLAAPGRGGALAGVVVVELSRTFAGQMAGGLLADLGATVIKVEPRGGSPLRTRGPASRGGLALLPVREPRQVLGEGRPRRARDGALARAAPRDGRRPRRGPRAGALEAAGLGPDALERATRASSSAHLALRSDGAARGRARRRSHRAGLLRRAIRDRLPRPTADPRHRAARRGVDGDPRRERAPDGDLPRAPERSRAGRRSRPLRDGAAHAGGRGRSLRPDGRGDDAHGYRVAHRRPRQRLPDARRRMDRRLRRRRSAVRPSLRGGGGAGRAPGSALRHSRRAPREPRRRRRARRRLDRDARPRRGGSALRRRRRHRHGRALGRRDHRRPAREGPRGSAVPSLAIRTRFSPPRRSRSSRARRPRAPERSEAGRAHGGGSLGDRRIAARPRASADPAPSERARVGPARRNPRARPLAVARRPGGGGDPRRLRRRRHHGRAAGQRRRRRSGPRGAGLRRHQPQQAQRHPRRARAPRPRGVSRAGAPERRDRRELPPGTLERYDLAPSTLLASIRDSSSCARRASGRPVPTPPARHSTRWALPSEA